MLLSAPFRRSREPTARNKSIFLGLEGQYIRIPGAEGVQVNRVGVMGQNTYHRDTEAPEKTARDVNRRRTQIPRVARDDN